MNLGQTASGVRTNETARRSSAETNNAGVRNSAKYLTELDRSGQRRGGFLSTILTINLYIGQGIAHELRH